MSIEVILPPRPVDLVKAMSTTFKAVKSPFDLELFLNGASVAAGQASSEFRKIERLLRGTGQIGSCRISYGPNGRYHEALNLFDAVALTLSDLPHGAVFERVEDHSEMNAITYGRVLFSLPALRI